MVRQTWAGNPNVLLNIRGQNEAGPGQDLLYEITAENRSAVSAQGIVVLPIPPLTTYVQSNPPGTLQGSTVLWNVNLLPSTTTKITATLRRETAGTFVLRPEFHRTDSVVTPVAVPNPTPSVPNPSMVFPGAGTPSTPPPSPSVLPGNPPPTFQPKPVLSVQIESSEVPVERGKPFIAQIYVTNAGTTDAKNVYMLVPLPQEYRGKEINAGWGQLTSEFMFEGTPDDWLGQIDEVNHRAVLRIPVISPGKTAQFAIEYLSIDQQGHEITCTVFAEGQEVTRGTQLIKP
jgi:hypothetical protein